MKIRNGFVSNSSSSSFIMLLPKNKSISQMTQEHLEKARSMRWWRDIPTDDQLIEMMTSFLTELQNRKYVYENDGETIKGYAYEIFKDYVLTSVDGAPDDGKYVLIDRTDIERVMNEN